MGLLSPAADGADEAEGIIQRRLAWILDAGEPEAVVLFGSAARGQFTVASDLDFALIYRDATALRAGRAAVHARRPPDPWPADYLFYTRQEFDRRCGTGGVCELIRAEGRLLHGSLG